MVAIPRARLIPPRVRSRASTASARAPNRPIRFLSSTPARPRPRSRVARVTNDQSRASEAIARRRAAVGVAIPSPKARRLVARVARAFVRAREIRASFPRAASRGASVVRARACGARRRVAAPPPRSRAAARFQPERARARDGAVGASNAMRDAVFRDRSLDLYLVTVYSYPKVGSFSYRVTSDDEP